MNAATAADEAGITYRQLDHWIHRGYIRPAIAHPGSGIQRSLLGSEVKVLNIMAELVRLGFKADRASELARRLASGRGDVSMGDSFRLTYSPKGDAA